jgi:hypothetical protein
MGSLKANGQVVAEDTRSIVIAPQHDNPDSSRDSQVTIENVSDPGGQSVKLAVLLERGQNVALFKISGVNMARFKLKENDPYYAPDRTELNAWHSVAGKEWHPYRIPRAELPAAHSFTTSFKVAPRRSVYQRIRWAAVYSTHGYNDGMTFFGETDLPPRPGPSPAARRGKPTGKGTGGKGAAPPARRATTKRRR